jgi:hypothetical protein
MQRFARLSISRPVSLVPVRSFALYPQKRTTDDQYTTTSWSKIADRSAEVFFLTEIWRALWLTCEIAFKPRVTINYPFEKVGF